MSRYPKQMVSETWDLREGIESYIGPANEIDSSPVYFHERLVLKDLVGEVCPKTVLDQAIAKPHSAVFPAQRHKLVDIEYFTPLAKFSLPDDCGTVCLPVL